MTRYGKRSAGKRGTEAALSLRMVQLLVCLVIFSSVYVSKGVFPHKIQRLSQDITTLVSTTVDLRQSLADLGEAVGAGEEVIGQIGAFCVEVFGGGLGEDSVAVTANPTIVVELPQTEAEETGDVLEVVVESNGAEEQLEEEIEAEVVVAQEEMEIMAVGLVYIADESDQRVLPAGYTYDMLSLGGMERATPVMGVISSGFGYRVHPLTGTDTIHNGVDIAGEIGDDIVAFGSGTVEYIGYSDTYGNYFRIDHENGVKSFYAHCDTLLVSKGNQVETGQVVATVGATGDVTGPHLHLELLCNDIRIDPALYIDSL